MVQIIAPDIISQIGTAAGQGFQEGIGQGSQIGFQQGQLGKIFKNIGQTQDPIELAKALTQASVIAPGSERFLGNFLPQLVAAQQAKASSSPEVQEALGKLTAPTANQTVTEKQSLSDTGQFLRNTLGDQYFPNVQPVQSATGQESYTPQKPPLPPKPIGLPEEGKIRRALMQQGVTNPYVQNSLIDQMKKDQINSYEAQKEGFQNIQAYQQAKKAEDDRFFSSVQPALEAAHGQMSPQKYSIWQGLSRLPENSGPDNERYANTESMFNNVVSGPIEEFEAIGDKLPYFSAFQDKEIKNRLEDSRSKVQDQLKRIDDRSDFPDQLKSQIKADLRDSFMSSMAAKDWGTAQASYAVANVSPESLSKIPKAPPPRETLAETVYLADPKVREKKVSELANVLTQIKPDDSLILLREKALENNYDEKAFNEALRKAVASGQLRLSDYQALERQRLAVPQRLDLNSIMEGKRNISDLFKRKK